MEHNDQLHVEAEEALANINKKTGRNMPQAVATGAVLVIIILASLLIRIDVFVLLIVVFMVLALWELRVDFATVGLHIPVVALWLCSADILLGINGVRSSIVVFPSGDDVLVSARSDGTVNVQLIMEYLGGGGNHSSAGAQIMHGSVREVEVDALSAIQRYQQDEQNND